MTDAVLRNTTSASQNAVLQILVKKYHLKNVEEIRRYIPLREGSILTPFSLLIRRIIHFVKHFQFIKTRAVKECLQKECAAQLNLKLKDFSSLTEIKAEHIKAFESSYKQMQILKKVFSGTKVDLGLDNLLKTSTWGVQKTRYDTVKAAQTAGTCLPKEKFLSLPPPPPAPPSPLAIRTSSSSIWLSRECLKNKRHSLNHVPEPSSKGSDVETVFRNRITQQAPPTTPTHVVSDRNREIEAGKGNVCGSDEWEEEENNFEDLYYPSTTLSQEEESGSRFISADPPCILESNTPVSQSETPPMQGLTASGRISELAKIWGGAANKDQLNWAAGRKSVEIIIPTRPPEVF
ncbi:hypothetical protein [Parachlamydia sp. AcF125]|uniref:hypothetical protein n=1 Tax=Parachlamydia sp. AcF125 TaxID=2795736 RepID=UPI001BCA3F82|nr:hypothetical protein [Parachlamydia sp. AcF125]MBS4168234.1 hypothetical protein [Parachlamydia sp. AcF125]